MDRLHLLIYSSITPETEFLLRAASNKGVESLRTEDCSTASAWLRKHKCDGVVIDSALPDAEDVILSAHQSSSNKKAAVLSIVDATNEPHNRMAGLTAFVLWRGSPRSAVQRIFTVFYASMVAERQRYFRCPVGFLVQFRKEDQSDGSHNAQALNLSRGGIAMKAQNLKEGDLIVLDFTLPKCGPDIQLTGRVVRSLRGCVGVNFTTISDKMNELLQRWLSEQCTNALSRHNLRSAAILRHQPATNDVVELPV